MPIVATREDVHELRAELRDEMRARRHEHPNTHIDVRDLSTHVHGFRGLRFAIYSLLRHG